MSWVKDGNLVTADYLGVKVTGTVESSRVKYGGKVQYTVRLDQPIKLPYRNEESTLVLVDNTEIINDFGVEVRSPFATVNS